MKTKNHIRRRRNFQGIALLMGLMVFLPGLITHAAVPVEIHAFPNPDFLPAGLVQGANGNFYGTTSDNGYDGRGGFFKITPDGSPVVLAWFGGTNETPGSPLVLGADGFFYGAAGGNAGKIVRLILFPKFNGLTRRSEGNLLNAIGPANQALRLWASPTLGTSASSWTLLTSNSFDGNCCFTYTDTGALTNNSRFYRITLP